MRAADPLTALVYQKAGNRRAPSPERGDELITNFSLQTAGHVGTHNLRLCHIGGAFLLLFPAFFWHRWSFVRSRSCEAAAKGSELCYVGHGLDLHAHSLASTGNHVVSGLGANFSPPGAQRDATCSLVQHFRFHRHVRWGIVVQFNLRPRTAKFDLSGLRLGQIGLCSSPCIPSYHAPQSRPYPARFPFPLLACSLSCNRGAGGARRKATLGLLYRYVGDQVLYGFE